MKGLKSVCLENKEKLFLANSKDIISFILEMNLVDFYPHFAIDKEIMKQAPQSPNLLQADLEKDQ